MEIKKEFSYRDYLRREFQLRIRRNPAYSLRAFARDLGVLPSKLSEVLNQRCGLGESCAVKLCKKLNLSEVEAQHFVTLVEVEHSRSAFKRAQAQILLEKFSFVHGYSELDLERFRIISDWYHNAILELSELGDFISDETWISQRLKITQKEASEAILRLLNFGLLKWENGRLIQTQAHLATPTDIPSHEIREHHLQILNKASESIGSFSVEERDLSSMTFAINSNQISEIKIRLRQFRRELMQELQVEPKKNRVYCLSMQLFPLEVGQEGKATT